MDYQWQSAPGTVMHCVTSFFGGKPEDLYGSRVGAMPTAFLHTFVRPGEMILDWVERQNDLDPAAASTLMQLLSRENMRELFMGDLDTTQAGMDRPGRVSPLGPRGQMRSREEGVPGECGVAWQRCRFDGPNW